MLVVPSFVDQGASSVGQNLLQKNEIWNNTLFLPPVGAATSLLLLLLQVISTSHRHKSPSDDENPENSAAQSRGEGASAEFLRYTKQHGGLAIFTFKIVRLLGCVALLVLAIFNLLENRADTQFNGPWWDVLHKKNAPFLALVGTHWYTVVLSSLSLFPSQWSQSFVRHVNFTSFATFSTFIYRDIWPLATYTQQPIDLLDKRFWMNLGLLVVTSAFIPLFVPRHYVAANFKYPTEAPNPEQTASIFSLAVYTFLDSIILEAYRVPHLSHERLPALSDTDRSQKLTKDTFPHIDPFHGAKKDRHIFWGLMRVFCWEYVGMALSLVGTVIAGFFSPTALNRILRYLEEDEQDLTIRPWFWIFLLFCGPFFVSLCFQWYTFLGTRTTVRSQAVLSQLVFEHSLRIRLNAEASSSDHPKSALPSQTLTPQSGAMEQTAAEASSVKSADSATQKEKNNLIGKINTLVTVDVDNVANGKDFLMIAVQVPLELILSAVFLYIVLGWSALAGIGSIMLLLPVPGYIAKLLQGVSGQKMEKTEARVEAVTQTINVLRMIKLFGWENRIKQQLDDAREEELKFLWKEKTLAVANDIINSIIPIITMLITYSSYTLIAKQPLTPSKIFSSMAVFDVVRNLFHRTSSIFTMTLRGKVALDRISRFLVDTELLDNFSEETCTEITISKVPEANQDAIGFNNATFTWSKEAESDSHVSSRSFRLKVPEMLEFKKGKLNLIVGPTGSGKTSILMALLGEMHFLPSSADSWYNLPRDRGVAYAAQESWVQNETIRGNILFGSPYDEERYQKVLRQCALETDLKLFEAGDKTEVGERGLTLSGGQKARVTLARAVYSSAEIVLLDDILAALDVHTSKHIVEECLQGDLLQDRTVILVTHNVAICAPIAERIVAVDINGIAHEIFDLSGLINDDKTLAAQIDKGVEEEEIKKEILTVTQPESKGSEGKLILAEELATGQVGWKAIKMYIKSLGGATPLLFIFFWILGAIIVDVSFLMSVWFLGYWGTQYEHQNPDQVNTAFYLSGYTAILFINCVGYGACCLYYNYGTQRASRSVNSQLIDSILHATMRWLDETPASRMITRCTQDIAGVDTQFTLSLRTLVAIFLYVAIRLCAPIYFTPIFLLPSIFIGGVGACIANVYLKAQMSVKREQSNARSPLLAHLGAAITGLVSVRAYGSQDAFKAESLKRIDHFSKISRITFDLSRWIGIRTDLLGASFTAALASYLVATRKLNAANTGFLLNISLDLGLIMLYTVRTYNDFELQANSLERIQAYYEIEHEPQPTEEGKPPAAWPTSGALRVEKLSARYSSDGPTVLKELTFDIKAGERIGIVGRTGSGKSSLTLSLLRCILTEGNVYLDGIMTNRINLDALRSSITVIPQVPELLSGTLRRNVDPFQQHDDAALNSALRAAGLFALQSHLQEAVLTLDSDVSSGGKNLSVGQRQIIALARAMVHNSKLLILDEATSAIDHKTDAIIQSTLRNELTTDTTVLTIAHRLQTIMDADRIMVLDSGRIVEFDTPQELLLKKGGQFKALVDGSNDKKALYAVAEKNAIQRK